MTETAMTMQEPAGRRSETDDRHDLIDVLGAVTWMLSQSQESVSLSAGDIVAMLKEPVRLRQVRIVRRGGLPVACIAWAYLGEAVVARIATDGGGLWAEDWRSGEEPWIVHNFGDQAAKRQAEDALTRTVFGGRPPRIFSDIAAIRIIRLTQQMIDADAVSLTKLIVAMRAERAYPLDELDDVTPPPTALARFIEHPAHSAHVATLAGRPIGLFLGKIDRAPADGTIIGAEIGSTIAPEFSGRGVGLLMLRGFEGWAAAQGATSFVMTANARLSEVSLANVTATTGYEAVGTVLRKIVVR